jgi:hypothetical protein
MNQLLLPELNFPELDFCISCCYNHLNMESVNEYIDGGCICNIIEMKQNVIDELTYYLAARKIQKFIVPKIYNIDNHTDFVLRQRFSNKWRV